MCLLTRTQPCCVRVRSCSHKESLSAADCASRRECVARNGEKKARRDRVQVYKGSWKGGDLPLSSFIRTAAFSAFFSLSPILRLYSLFRLLLLGSFSRVSAFLFLSSLFVLSLLSFSRLSSYSERRKILRAQEGKIHFKKFRRGLFSSVSSQQIVVVNNNKIQDVKNVCKKIIFFFIKILSYKIFD